MTRRIARVLALGGLAAAMGCATGLPRRVPGSNITLPASSTDIIRDILAGCEQTPGEATVGRASTCGSVIGGTRAVPAAPVSPPENRAP
jgi:hypothetical protein